MVACRRAVALWCAVALAATASGYTVDCNQEYTDCETELSKLSEDEDLPLPNSFSSNSEIKRPPMIRATTTTTSTTTTTTTTTTTESPQTTTEVIESRTEESMTGIPDETLRPSPRLLFSNADDLQNFANALHNQSQALDKKKDLIDLSDVNLDDEEEPVKLTQLPAQIPKMGKDINDKFFSNLQAPFHSMLVGVGDMEEDSDTCKENDVVYKVGERLERGCEESCECVQGGTFECFPRCKHPYIRRGRRLNDPLCFESPVDECCSIIACATGNEGKGTKLEICRYGNETHTVGAKWFVGCEQTCICEPNSIVTCKPRCNPIRASENCINVQDPNDACCEIQVCDVSHDAHEEPENITSSTTTTTTTTTTTELIPELAHIQEVHQMISMTEPSVLKSTMRPLVLAEPIGSVKVLQNNTVQVNLIHSNSSEDPIHLQLSSDGGKTFQDVQLIYSNLILNLEGGKDYVIKTKETGTRFNFTITTTDNNQNEVKPTEEIKYNLPKIGCIQDGQFYDVGEEFHIGCSELCECTGPNMRECAALVCPSHVGLELMSKNCVRWAPNPPAEPPNCCPRAARCLSDGTCHYKGVAIPNWTEVPVSVSGCEERCFCENGELDCTEACTALPAVPPQTLRCPPLHRPGPVNISDEDCCKQWGCVPIGTMGTNFGTHDALPAFLPTVPPDDRVHFPQEDIADYDQNNIHRPGNLLPPGLPMPPVPYGDDNKKLSVLSMQADSPSSVKMLFGLPSVLVGLRGSVDLRYTDQADDDISHWHSQVFAPTDEVLTTPRLEFTLSGLKPSTTYKIRGKLYLHNLPVEPESEIRIVRTLDPPTAVPTEEKRREVDSNLSVMDVNDTVAHVSWRHFTEEELQLIDGIQVRYRPIGTPIYSMTELLHHGRSSAELHDLRPGTRYEASLVLVPPPKAFTELHDPGRVEFTTSPYVDPYNWTVTIEARAVGSEAAELTWRGVPSPAERWVRVYRAAHACGASSSVRREHDAFRLAARDLPPAVTLTGLEPNTRCRVWLELFLTNGKVKTSNVLEINTKTQDSPEPIDNEIESASIAGSRTSSRTDYYGALVVVGVVAALGALTSLLLLLVVVRRHHTRSVPITTTPSAPRESSLPPYDNPAYKLELQQETMDL
ncbi:putative epidermal cell surface receptor isoform X1 [Plodia interpunctella]|uniref:putative epidermal cell surface receptor isoform X1 n=1 Tax=Plodia interpunctella TaxID=58824 RepID=UPI00236786EE|nr:putative epidermal cell surface receptor isoform X2 [Plodia interpunctella]